MNAVKNGLQIFMALKEVCIFLLNVQFFNVLVINLKPILTYVICV